MLLCLSGTNNQVAETEYPVLSFKNSKQRANEGNKDGIPSVRKVGEVRSGRSLRVCEEGPIGSWRDFREKSVEK